MKIGQAVRVIASKHVYQFAIGEIVHRTPTPYDDECSVGFTNSSGQLRYMTADEYELVDGLVDDEVRRKILRKEAIAILERFIAKNEIFQTLIDVVAKNGEEAEYLRGLTVSVELL